MRPGARPSTRAPFRHTHVERQELLPFVQKLLQKKWIEKSNSQWVSNMFAVPKRDPITGELPSKIQWVRVGDPTLRVRWVIDYLYVNSLTEVPHIPIPRIDELFDRLAGAMVFSLIDLAEGYHKMRMDPASWPYTAFRAGSEMYHWVRIFCEYISDGIRVGC